MGPAQCGPGDPSASTRQGTVDRGAGFPFPDGDLSWAKHVYRREANGRAVRHTYRANPLDREKKGG